MLDLEDEAAPGRFRQAVRAGLVQEGFVAPRYAFAQLVPKQITNLKLGKFACGITSACGSEHSPDSVYLSLETISRSVL